MVTHGGPFTTQRLILCEGIEDAAFLRQLINVRALGSFDVRPVEDIGGISGATGFASALTSSVPWRGFDKIRHIVLVADADTHYNKTFQDICSQIADANQDQNVSGKFVVPTAPYSASGGHPRLTIMLLPAAQTKGALESLLWNALVSIPKYVTAVQCADEACGCAGIATGNNKWGQSKLDKARVHAAVALINKKNPSVSLTRLWEWFPDLIPVEHHAFDSLAAAIAAI
jgi:hypothetical protein